MNKAQLIEEISEKQLITKAQAERIIDAITHTIKEKVKKGEDVKLIGFGTFTKNKRKTRNGHNPQTGEKIVIPAGWHPKFKPGAVFKELIR